MTIDVMKVDSDTTAGPAISVQAFARRPTGGDVEPTDPQIIANVVERLSPESPRFVSCAPGRLEVMGGLAEYMGSLVLSLPVGQCACVGVQCIPENEVGVTLAAGGDDSGESAVRIPIAELVARGAELAESSPACSASVPVLGQPVRSALGAVAEMLRERIIPRSDGGLFVVVGRPSTRGVDVGIDAAVVAATMAATTAARGAPLDVPKAAAICQRVQNHWLGMPVGIGDAACVLAGEPDALSEVECATGTLSGSIRLPDDVLLVGIDCGTAHADAMVKYERVRTAAFMGKALIERIVAHDGMEDLSWDGHLARIPIHDFVEHFRDRLPTRLKGREYLDRFGETGDPLTRVDPKFTYRIRSRTEHHIYEHARACQLSQCLRRMIRAKDEPALEEAGELMYASHWSYGQRCGLGSIETDFLVSALRRHGERGDIYGAKITGRGCGGSVAVLTRPSDKAFATLQAVIRAYEAKTGNRAFLLRPSCPGAFVRGIQRV